MIPWFYLADTNQKIKMYVHYNELYEIIFLHISLHLQSIIYMTAGFIVLHKAKKLFVENYSSNTIETYKWLFQLLLFIIALYFVAIIKNIFKFVGQQDGFDITQMILVTNVLCVVCSSVLKVLGYPNLFSEVDSKTKLTLELIKEHQNKKSVVNKEALKILKDPAKKEIMVLEILYEVGLIQNLLVILLLKNTQVAHRRNLKRKHYFNILIYYHIDE